MSVDGNKMKAFPKGLQILSGNQGARTFDANKLTVPGGRPIAERVNFACINYANPAPETYGITNLDCPQGFRAQVHFQSCWDGKSTSSSDQSHVAYLSQIDNGVCPPTHPILLPHLFYEVRNPTNHSRKLKVFRLLTLLLGQLLYGQDRYFKGWHIYVCEW